MVAALLAAGRIGAAGGCARRTRRALVVHHRVVVAGAAVPDRLVATVGRRPARHRPRRWRLRIANGCLIVQAGACTGSSTGMLSVLSSGDAVDRPVGVEASGCAGRSRSRRAGSASAVDQSHIVTTMLRSMPCGRARLRRGQLARGDAVGPVGEILQRGVRPDAAEAGRHVGHRLARLRAPRPRLGRVRRARRTPSGSCACLGCRARGTTGRRSSRCRSSAPGLDVSSGCRCPCRRCRGTDPSPECSASSTSTCRGSIRLRPSRRRRGLALG